MLCENLELRPASLPSLCLATCRHDFDIPFHHMQDVLLHYSAKKYGSGPIALGQRSPRQSYNPAAPDFLRERGSYQNPLEHP